MRMVILQIAQAPPFYHVSRASSSTVTTMIRLLICFKISENSSNARVLCPALVSGWLAGWLAVQQPPPPPCRWDNSGWVGLVIQHPPHR